MRQFKISKNPYDLSRNTYQTGAFLFNPGVTVLVGCNGSGKTTLMRCVEDELSKIESSEVVYKSFDNYSRGGSQVANNAIFYGDIDTAARAMVSSEGEKIRLWLCQKAKEIGQFVRASKNASEIWLFFDALDSGLSIDNICEIKENLFKTILDNNFGQDIYIIVSANNFEFADEQVCMNVVNGTHFYCNSYGKFKSEVLLTRKYKDKENIDD